MWDRGGDGECLTPSATADGGGVGWDLGHRVVDRRGPDRRGLSDGGAGRPGPRAPRRSGFAGRGRRRPLGADGRLRRHPATGGGGGGRSCAAAAGGPVDLVVVAVGRLGDQVSDVTRPEQVAESVTVNFTWPAAALTEVAVRLRAQGQGRVVVLSSIAGVRVRPANYLYGSAKRGLDAFALSLAEDLAHSGVTVQVVRPGFVRSKMTAGLKPAPFSVSADVTVAVRRAWPPTSGWCGCPECCDGCRSSCGWCPRLSGGASPADRVRGRRARCRPSGPARRRR